MADDYIGHSGEETMCSIMVETTTRNNSLKHLNNDAMADKIAQSDRWQTIWRLYRGYVSLRRDDGDKMEKEIIFRFRFPCFMFKYNSIFPTIIFSSHTTRDDNVNKKFFSAPSNFPYFRIMFYLNAHYESWLVEMLLLEKDQCQTQAYTN